MQRIAATACDSSGSGRNSEATRSPAASSPASAFAFAGSSPFRALALAGALAFAGASSGLASSLVLALGFAEEMFAFLPALVACSSVAGVAAGLVVWVPALDVACGRDHLGVRRVSAGSRSRLPGDGVDSFRDARRVLEVLGDEVGGDVVDA